MSGSGPIPNLNTKYTREERNKFDAILDSDENETPTLMSALTNREIPRFKEYHKDIIALEKLQKGLSAKIAAGQKEAEQAQAKGDGYMVQYNMYKAKIEELENDLQKSKQEEAELMRQQEEDKNSKKKKQCVIS